MTIYNDQTLDSSLIYLSGSQVYIEKRDDSIVGRLARIFFSLTGMRDYSIQNILKQREITLLIEKEAKRCGLDTENLKLLKSGNNKSITPLLKANNLALSRFAESSASKYFDKNLLNDLIAYTYKEKLVQKVADMTQLDVNLDDLPGDYQRLTLEQMRIIESMEKANGVATRLIERGADIQAFKNQSDRAKAFSEKVRAKANEEIKEEGVSIVCYDFDTSNALYKKKNVFQYFFWFLFRSNVEHVSLAYADGDEVKETHIAGNPVARFKKEVMPLSSYAYPRISINFERALESQYKQLRAVYGNEYDTPDKMAKMIRDKYTKIFAEQIRQRNDYEDLNSGFFARLLACLKPRIVARGTWKDQLKFSGKTALCSQFVIVSMLEAFKVLNQQYKTDAAKKNINSIPDLFPPVSNWTRMSTVLPGTIAAKAYDPRYSHHEPPKIISRLFDTQKTWLCLPI